MKAWAQPLWWGGWALVGALASLAGALLAASLHLPLWGGAALLGGLSIVLASFMGWLAQEGWFSRDPTTPQAPRWAVRLRQAQARLRALQDAQRAQAQTLERTRQAVQRAQRAASHALARATKAEQQARYWEAQARACQQKAQALAQRVATLEANLKRAERARKLLEAVHRLETWEHVLPDSETPTEDLAPEDLAQRLREAIGRLQAERDAALGAARQAEDALQHKQALLAAKQAEIAACHAQRTALQQRVQQAEARLRQVLTDLLAPQADIVALPLAHWEPLSTQPYQRRPWEALLQRVRDPRQRAAHRRPGPAGGWLFAPPDTPRRVLFFEQPFHKHILWVCRLWDTPEQAQAELARAAAPTRAMWCPEPTAFLYWLPPADTSAEP